MKLKWGKDHVGNDYDRDLIWTDPDGMHKFIGWIYGPELIEFRLTYIDCTPHILRSADEDTEMFKRRIEREVRALFALEGLA